MTVSDVDIKYQTWTPVPATQRVEVKRSLMTAVEKFTAYDVFDKWKGQLEAIGNQLGFDPSLQISSHNMTVCRNTLLELQSRVKTYDKSAAMMRRRLVSHSD